MALSYAQNSKKKVNLKQECESLQEQNKELIELVAHYQDVLYGSLKKHSIECPKGFYLYESYIFPHYLDETARKWFLTFSHDPKFLSFNRINQAINYYIKIISESLEQLDDYDNIKIFGCFELNKAGNVHAHLIYQSYIPPYTLCDIIKPKLTHRTYLNVSTDIKEINDTYVNQTTGQSGLKGTIDYIIKSPIQLYGKY